MLLCYLLAEYVLTCTHNRRVGILPDSNYSVGNADLRSVSSYALRIMLH